MTGKQLKNSILQWAIQGKLVPQDPNDEPASVLLEKIRAEKARLVKEGKIKKDKKESIIYRGEDNSHYEKFADGTVVCIDDEIPFDVPKGWEWCRIGTLFAHNNGKQLNKGNSKGTMMEYITTSNLYWDGFILDNLKKMPFEDNEIERCQAVKGDLLVCEGGDVGRSCIWTYDRPIMLQNHIHKLRAYYPLCTDYFFYIFWLYNMSGIIGGKGIGIQGFSSKALHNTLAPLPPLCEQQRIVTKLQKLLPVVEQYDSAQSKLDSLNKDIKPALRKSILQEAIQGKLVPQDPNDEPASVLIQRIKEEKQKLVKEGKLKKKDIVDSVIFKGDDNRYYEQIGKDVVDITEDIPFEIPDSWESVRIENYVKIVTDYVASGSFASLRENVRYYKTPNYAVLVKAQDFQYDFKKGLTYTDEKGYNYLSGSNLFGGELILSNVGSIGKVFIVPKLNIRMSLAPNSIMVKTFYEQQVKWLYYMFSSEFGIQRLFSISSATAIRKFNKTCFKRLIIPIPPLAEQQRIVSQIEKIFSEIKGN